MRFNRTRKHKGFTLAEVLVALTIIGVVASLTIPSLTNNINDQQHTVALRKVFSELLQATDQIQSAGIGLPLTNDSSGVRNAYGNVLKFIKTDKAVNIWGDVGYNNNLGTYRNYKGSAPAYMHLLNNEPAAILANGTYIGFTSRAREASGFHEIYVDLNGSKEPNMYGFDLHKFIIKYINNSYRLLPYETSGSCTNGSTTWDTSWPCTALRLATPEKMP